MLTLGQLWEAFLSLLVIAGMIVIVGVTLAFFVAMAQSYQKTKAKERQEPQPPAPEKLSNLVEHRLGPSSDAHRWGQGSQDAFCPVCHYRISVCHDIHSLHGEQVPAHTLPRPE
jgi:hypothetical protein